MKKPLKYLLASAIVLVLGGAIGYGSAVWAYDLVYESASLKNGPWFTNLTIGSEEAGIYTRAAVAEHGLFALAQSEAVYYTAYADEDGQPLRGGCDYRIEGKDLDARWWSITVYGEDDFLIPNDENRYSYNGKNVTYDADGRYTIHLSRTAKEGDWLPAGNEEKLSLWLRLYNPGPAFYESASTVELPRIVREGCK